MDHKKHMSLYHLNILNLELLLLFLFVGRAVCKLGLLQRRCSDQKGYEKEIWL